MRSVMWVVLLLSCGRTPVDAFDAGVVDAGIIEAPLFVFTGSLCPAQGTEADLTPMPSDGLALVRFRAQGECSGAGGEWLIGREVGSSRDFFVGEHACYFFPELLRDSAVERFGVVRFSQTAALFHAPTGWCITNANGMEPVTTDSKSLAWGVYATEAGARAAYERLR